MKEEKLINNEEIKKDLEGFENQVSEINEPKDGQESSSLYRVVISGEASECLDTLVSKVNTGFDGGKVTRPQLLSWLLSYFHKHISIEQVQEVRSIHFDRLTYLEALLKRAKENGSIPRELEALVPECFRHHSAAKRSKKNTG